MVAVFLFMLMLFCGLVISFKSRLYNARDLALLSLLLKLSLCSLALYITLPFGGADGVRFERRAWFWSQGSLFDVISTLDVSRSYVYSSIIALFYNVIERNIAIPIFINGVLGVLIFYYSLVLATETWGRDSFSRTFAFIVAASPMLNVNSAIILRENFIALFALLAAIQLVRYARDGKPVFIIFFMFFILMASFFHGGMIVFSIGLPLFIVFGGRNIGTFNRLAMLLVSVSAFFVVMSFMEFGKLSEVKEEGVTVEYLAEVESRRSEANTAYLTGMEPAGLYDILWQGPVRSLFLLMKPFPWDVRNVGHFIVLLDAAIWWGIIWLLWRNRAAIGRNPSAFALFLACSVTILAFAYGTGNYGTAVRHRTKFLVLALVLVAPFLPRFRFSER